MSWQCNAWIIIMWIIIQWKTPNSHSPCNAPATLAPWREKTNKKTSCSYLDYISGTTKEWGCGQVLRNPPGFTTDANSTMNCDTLKSAMRWRAVQQTEEAQAVMYIWCTRLGTPFRHATLTVPSNIDIFYSWLWTDIIMLNLKTHHNFDSENTS